MCDLESSVLHGSHEQVQLMLVLRIKQRFYSVHGHICAMQIEILCSCPFMDSIDDLNSF